MERVDIAIIGTGPAGVSAAITAKVRNKSVLLIGSRELSEKMSKAHQILNYPGLPEVSGADLVAGYCSTSFPNRKNVAFTPRSFSPERSISV